MAERRENGIPIWNLTTIDEHGNGTIKRPLVAPKKPLVSFAKPPGQKIG